jgi:hypothetical protein
MAFVVIRGKMKKLLIFIFIFSAAVCCFGQPKDTGKKTDAALDIVIKKQIICDQLERQTQEIQFAAVRVYIRYKIAAWLWKDGKDNSGRAKGIAIRAVEDLYENKSDVPQYYLDFRKRLRDQFYAEVAEKALKANEADSAN